MNPMTILVYSVMILFGVGVVNLYRHLFDMYRFEKTYLKKPDIDVRNVLAKASRNGGLPYFAIMVPAREEVGVIENTIRRLEQFDYPKYSYEILIITDEREVLSNPGENTTNVARIVAQELNEKYHREFVKVAIVPVAFDGYYSGQINGKNNRSTKGRALNWGLREIPDHVDMIGVYDADARTHPHLLKFVASRRLKLNIDVIQGPVYPVSNYDKVTTVPHFAGLHLAWWHRSSYPKLGKEKKKLQFLAGTNYFIDKDLIRRIGGWDYEALTEDAELGLRLYSREKRFAKWHPYEEIEQSPKNFRAFFHQRRRWAEGFLQLVPQIRKTKMPKWDRLSILSRIYTAPLVWVFTEVGPLLGAVLYFTNIYKRIPPSLPVMIYSYALLIGTVSYLALYPLMYHKLYQYIEPKPGKSKRLLQYAKLGVLTIPYWLLQALPEMSAMKRYLLSQKTMVWEKTERTDERVPGSKLSDESAEKIFKDTDSRDNWTRICRQNQQFHVERASK